MELPLAEAPKEARQAMKIANKKFKK